MGAGTQQTADLLGDAVDALLHTLGGVACRSTDASTNVADDANSLATPIAPRQLLPGVGSTAAGAGVATQ